MKELKKELKLYFAEKLIYLALCICPEKVDAFVRKEKEQIEGVVKEKRIYIENKKPIKISDFHIGFEYQYYAMDGERYFNKGMIWQNQTYTFNSPRLHKIQKLIEQGLIRKKQ